ncbi:hypothetical protein AAFF_G00211260 [Aldrovandia affinis]|uniref:BTB domain-containing protein n=1 Tax=Aldrovandia affinis TaxID=143900 RepID=A0AAD7WV41_9TELE|nr:hypothetical protein AAFF_G00211260 [Aldrovandia affinis]
MDSTKFRTEAYIIFNELRQSNMLCDVVIEVQQSKFIAHKAILYANSSYFCTLFDSQDQQSYEITGLSPDIMELVIQYIYTSDIPIREKNVENLLRAADKLCVKGLTTACCKFLQVHLSAQNCIATWRTADMHFAIDLRHHAYRYILHHFAEVSYTSRDFPELSFVELRDIIEEDELNVRKEDVVFESIMRWIEHVPIEREHYISLLLPKVRMGLMNADYFMDSVKSNPLVKESDKCHHIIVEGMKALFDYGMNRSHPNLSNLLSRPRLPFAILLAMGGWSGSIPTNAIESYDSRAGCWVNVTQETESPRAYHGAVYLNGFVYCLGGYNSMEYFSSMRRFNPVTFTWKEVAPMYSRRCYVSVAVLDGYIYAMGGLDGHVRLSSAERYKPETNQWHMISPMNEQRSDASATILNGKVYICGGFNGQDCLFTAEFYDPQTNHWTQITPMINRRSGLGTIAYEDEVYVVGGFDGTSRLRSADAYDPLTHNWRSVPEMITARSNFGLEVLDNQLFVIGGFNGTATTDYAECYDKKTDEWSVVHCMAFCRSALTCCVIPNPANLARFVLPRPRLGHSAAIAVPPLPSNDSPSSSRL